MFTGKERLTSRFWRFRRAIAYYFFVQVTNKKKGGVVDIDEVKSLTTEDFMRIYDVKWAKHDGDKGWVRSEFVNRLLGREIRHTVTEEDAMAAASVVETAFDAVGVTSEFDKLMVLIADVLGWPLSMLTYKKLKVITNRPSISSFPPAVVK